MAIIFVGTFILEYILFRSLSRVQVLGHRLRGCRVHILYGCFLLLDPLTLCFANSKRLGGHTQWVHFFKSARHSEALHSTSWLHSRKHSNYACSYPTRSGGTRRLLSLTMTRSGAWRTRVLGVSHRGTAWMGPRMAHDLLKHARQGGVDFKLFRST